MSLAPAADFLILDADGRSAVTVEAKTAPPRWSRGWEEEEERLRAAAEEDGSRFAVLVSPKRLWVWDRSGADPTVADARPLLDPSFEAIGLDPETVRGFAFEMLCEQLFRVLTDPRPESWGKAQFAGPAAYLRGVAPDLAATLTGGRLTTAAAASEFAGAAGAYG